MSEIGLVVEDDGDRTAVPPERAGRVQARVGRSVLLVIIIGRVHDLLFRQQPRNLVRTFPPGAEAEYPLYDRRRFLVGHDALANVLVPAVAVGRPAAEKLAPLALLAP